MTRLRVLAAFAAVVVSSSFLASPASAATPAMSHGTIQVQSGGIPASWVKARASRTGQYNATSTNWSGYAVNGAFGAVNGSWVVPAAICGGANGTTTYSSFWVGLDGYSSSTVEQLGTETDCANGTPSYYAWWEMYPAASQQLPTTTYPVSPGDHITASVLTNIGLFSLRISSSRGWSDTITQSGPAPVHSAEWIAEAPSDSFGPLPLTNFGTVSFSACTTNNNTPISGSGAAVAITMQLTKHMPSGEIGTLVEAQPSTLTAGGTAFTDTAFPDGHRYQL